MHKIYRGQHFTLLGGSPEWIPIEALDCEFQVRSHIPRRKPRRGVARSHRYQGHDIAIGHFFSAKSGQTFRYDSALEKMWFSVLEDDPGVLRFFREPFVIHYIFNGKDHHYKPDLLVEYADGRSVIVEIKHPMTVEEPRNKCKHEAAAKWCARKGIAFQVWTLPSKPPIAF